MRPLLAPAQLDPAALTAMQGFHSDIVGNVQRTIERDPLVVVGMKQNPFVRKVRKALSDAGVPFTYLEYGSYLSEWKPRLAIKLWSGWPTFPQVFLHGVLLGGHRETRALLDSGELQRRLAAKR